MNPPLRVPVLPESAPFTPEQRAYLNGFFAGLFSSSPLPLRAAAERPPPPPMPLAILYGSQTGNAETLAKRAAGEAGRRGFAVTVWEMARYPREQLAGEERVLVITSTYGDGEPPDNAKAFWEFLADKAAPRLPKMKFAVLALGDSNYPKFCQCGKDFDQRLAELGAHRVATRVDCDVDHEAAFGEWLEVVLPALRESEGAMPLPEGGGATAGPPASTGAASVGQNQSDVERPRPGNFSRQHPFPARLLAARPLNEAGSARDTRHVELALAGSGLSYEAGDALGVVPTNCPVLVDELLRALGCAGDEAVRIADGREVSLREALLSHLEITRIPPPLLATVAQRSGDARLKDLTASGANGELDEFLRGRDILDLLLAHPGVKFAPQEFVALLKRLQPRLYSIASSPKAHPGQAHLTVGVVRYESHGRLRKGVCSTFLAERVTTETAVPVFVQPNRNFRLPTDTDRPIIMVGPGTGIAPFRAFLQERRATGAGGQSWLFFGAQRAATDFLYRDELEAFRQEGTLSRLAVAFSRDQPEKVYVQHRMLEHARELWAWLAEGAHFYVCGDAKRMARDVHDALHQVIELGGGRSREQATDYVRQMQSERRYQRDVY